MPFRTNKINIDQHQNVVQTLRRQMNKNWKTLGHRPKIKDQFRCGKTRRSWPLAPLPLHGSNHPVREDMFHRDLKDNTISLLWFMLLIRAKKSITHTMNINRNRSIQQKIKDHRSFQWPTAPPSQCPRPNTPLHQVCSRCSSSSNTRSRPICSSSSTSRPTRNSMSTFTIW